MRCEYFLHHSLAVYEVTDLLFQLIQLCKEKYVKTTTEVTADGGAHANNNPFHFIDYEDQILSSSRAENASGAR